MLPLKNVYFGHDQAGLKNLSLGVAVCHLAGAGPGGGRRDFTGHADHAISAGGAVGRVAGFAALSFLAVPSSPLWPGAACLAQAPRHSAQSSEEHTSEL